MDTDDTVALGEMLRDGALYRHAPASLRARVVADLRDASANRKAFRWAGFMPVSGRRALAGLAACAMVSMGVLLWQRPSPADVLTREIVSSHVRALLSTRAVDVLSGDQHTVKPWFNGRLDYAPPVVDTAALGFPLVGGRLDYVGRRPVAVMVYAYRKHPIDLYVFPARGQGPAVPVARSEDGYAIAHWQRDDMAYWAITDASPASLRQFTQAQQTEAGR